MNCEQIQHWLTELNTMTGCEVKGLGPDELCKFLETRAQNSEILIDYLARNYADQELSEPIFGQLLATYYRGGALREFVLQFLPTLTATYLIALSKRQHQSLAMLETLFVAIYNEEILTGEPGEPNVVKKQEIVRVPSLRVPSIYHDPAKLGQSVVADAATLSRISAPSSSSSGSVDDPVQFVVKIGPYPSVDRLTAENRYSVLQRLIKSVNAGPCQALRKTGLGRFMCHSAVALCSRGFDFPESDLIARIFGPGQYLLSPRENSCLFSAVEDISECPRVMIRSGLLLEMLNGIYMAMFNGASVSAIAALDAIHQRARFELWPDVLLVTNAVIKSLVDPADDLRQGLDEPCRLSTATREKARKTEEKMAGDLNWREKAETKPRRQTVTNASLKIRRMPEDIPVKLPESENRQQNSEKQEKPEKQEESKRDAMENAIKKKIAALRPESRKSKTDSPNLDSNEEQTNKAKVEKTPQQSKMKKWKLQSRSPSTKPETVHELDEGIDKLEMVELLTDRRRLEDAALTDAFVEHLAEEGLQQQSHKNGPKDRSHHPVYRRAFSATNEIEKSPKTTPRNSSRSEYRSAQSGRKIMANKIDEQKKATLENQNKVNNNNKDVFAGDEYARKFEAIFSEKILDTYQTAASSYCDYDADTEHTVGGMGLKSSKNNINFNNQQHLEAITEQCYDLNDISEKSKIFPNINEQKCEERCQMMSIPKTNSPALIHSNLVKIDQNVCDRTQEDTGYDFSNCNNEQLLEAGEVDDGNFIGSTGAFLRKNEKYSNSGPIDAKTVHNLDGNNCKLSTEQLKLTNLPPNTNVTANQTADRCMNFRHMDSSVENSSSAGESSKKVD